MDLFFWPSRAIGPFLGWLPGHPCPFIIFKRARHVRMLENLAVCCFRILGTFDEREAVQGLSAIKLGQKGIAHPSSVPDASGMLWN